MTPADLTAAREALGLTAAALGRALELEGRDPGQQVKRWEANKASIPGPVRVALRYMLAERASQEPRQTPPGLSWLETPADPLPPVLTPQKPQDAPEPVFTVGAPADPLPPVLDPSESHGEASAPKGRRRG